MLIRMFLLSSLSCFTYANVFSSYEEQSHKKSPVQCDGIDEDWDEGHILLQFPSNKNALQFIEGVLSKSKVPEIHNGMEVKDSYRYFYEGQPVLFKRKNGEQFVVFRPWGDDNCVYADNVMQKQKNPNAFILSRSFQDDLMESVLEAFSSEGVDMSAISSEGERWLEHLHLNGP